MGETMGEYVKTETLIKLFSGGALAQNFPRICDAIVYAIRELSCDSVEVYKAGYQKGYEDARKGVKS